VDVPFGLLQLHLASSLQRQRLLKAWNQRHGIVALVMSGRPVLTLRKTLWRSIRKKRKTEDTQEPVATMLNIPQPTRTAAAQPRHDVSSREHLQGLEPHVRRLLGVFAGCVCTHLRVDASRHLSRHERAFQRQPRQWLKQRWTSGHRTQ
jgi:hypothetical protein